MFIVTKKLQENMVFPFNFGFVSGTLAPDGDALDVRFLNDEPFATNTLLQVHPLAVIKVTQTEVEGGKPFATTVSLARRLRRSRR